MTPQTVNGTRAARVPHTLVLLFGMMVVAWLMTWLLPQGSFDTVQNEAGRSLVVAGTYAPVDDRVQLSPLALFTAIPRAMADAAPIIFFVLIVGGAVGTLRASGAIDAGLGRALHLLAGHPGWLIAGGVTLFATASAALGTSAEYIPLVAILAALAVSLQFDRMTAVGIVLAGYGAGYGVAFLNPFTVLAAHEVAELQPGSGMWYRLLLFIPFVGIGIHHVWRYARRVQDDPARSLVAGLPANIEPVTETLALNGRHRACLLATLGTILLLIWGIGWRGWYLNELTATFFGLAVVIIAIGRLGASAGAQAFVQGAAELVGTALLIGFARGISLLLEDGQVLHTIVHGLSIPLQMVGEHLAAVGMLLVQTLLNLFIPSGSGQAYATMPIMTPVADLVGIQRQVAVLAFQFGDGFSNIVVPTNPVLMGILGAAAIPYDRWLRFVLPLLAKWLVAAAAALMVAVSIGYH